MKNLSFLVVAAGLAMASGANGEDILFIEGAEGGHPYSDQASNDLITLGHNVTIVTNPLGNYAGYDQVWDFRYTTQMTNQDIIDQGAYLASGGRMLVLGEHSGFEGSRNVSLRNWIAGVGGGNVGNYVQACAVGPQNVTGPGTIVMQPNNIGSLSYNCATTYNNPGSGFLVTDSGSGDGGLIAWDFGDLQGAPGARLIAAWDIELWETGVNGTGMTENFATYLGRIPAPGSAGLLGVAVLVAARRRRA
jgi:hypothetical protein